MRFMSLPTDNDKIQIHIMDVQNYSYFYGVGLVLDWFLEITTENPVENKR